MKFHTTILCLLLNSVVYSQIIFSGKIKSKKETLYNANIIAKPLTKEAKFAYAVTNEKGDYKLKLSANSSYKITISFIGYITTIETILIGSANTKKDFLLQEDPNELEEVIINYKEPVKVKKDTTTYRTDAFVNGKERKLRQVLKKLPGVEVDREGNITVKGKKVTQVLVEDKKFFTGDSKLAVNNIPAEVIGEIQVIEDYHESDLLKGLETSDKVALNINLKEGKKNFAFGDIEVGGGVKERYVIHPTVFKYSKKTSYGFIGDFNNIGRKSFTLKDYLNYEGGFDLNTFSSLYATPVARLLRNGDFNKNKHLFGGVNIQFSASEKNNWTAYAIALKDDTNILRNQIQRYLVTDLNENRLTKEQQNQNMILGKIQLKSKPSKDVRIKFENKVELITAKENTNTENNLGIREFTYSTNDRITNFDIKSNFKIEKKFSKFHTSQAKVNVNLSKNKEDQNWFSTENIFSNNLPIIGVNNINVKQESELKNYKVNLLLKHFWIVNPLNHLYVSFKNKIDFNDYKSILKQENEDRSTNLFEDFRNNNLNKELFSSLITEYKRLVGEAFLTLKLEYLNYNRFNKQFGFTNNKNYQVVLPSLDLVWDINNNKKVSFKYNLRNNFPNFSNLNRNNKLTGFNSIYRGNANLNKNYYHNLRISYRKFQTYGWSFYPTINYRLKTNKIQNVFIPDDIYISSSPINFENPEKELSTSFRTVYNYKYWKSSLRINYSNRNYVSFLRGDETKSVSNNILVNANFKTNYIKGPNIDIDISHRYADNENIVFKSISDRTKLDFVIDYEIGDLVFKGETLYNYYNNRVSKTKNSFNEINASIFYHKEDSLWSFEISGNNLGGNINRISSSFSDVIFNETRTAVFPRTILGKIIYKL